MAEQRIKEDIVISNSQSQTKFPIRSFTNVLLIILTTLQVFLIINSHVYLRADLFKSFLSLYADDEIYPELFSGNTFYLEIENITQLQQMLQYVCNQIDSSQTESFLNLNYKSAIMALQVQYLPQLLHDNKRISFPIDPSKGIEEPFNLKNISQIQLFLLQVNQFQIKFSNLSLTNQGFYETYIHTIVFHFEQSNQIEVNYYFQIDNALVSNTDLQRPQANYLIFLRLFYLCVLIIGLVSLYSNIIYISRTFKQFYSYLEKNSKQIDKSKQRRSIFQDLTNDDIKQIDENIIKWIKAKNITFKQIRWQHYLTIIEFDVFFSSLANIFQIIANIYLIFGREHEIIIGFGCLLSWMTIFRLLNKNKKLVLMYELLKLSIIRVCQFLVSFFIVFMGYTFLGMCLFPKVIFFCSMSKTVTTLISMMAGDSIDMITQAICDKYSQIMAIAYIFSYVIVFMHAIHNTLTSIIKEYYILKKIELIKEQKAKKGQTGYLYIEELKISSQVQKSQLPLKLTQKLQLELLKIKMCQSLKLYKKLVKRLLMLIEDILLQERMDLFDNDQQTWSQYLSQLQRRLSNIRKAWNKVENRQGGATIINASQITNE